LIEFVACHYWQANTNKRNKGHYPTKAIALYAALSHLWERVPEGRERALVQQTQKLLNTSFLFSLSPQPLSHKWERGAKTLLLNELRKRI